MISKLSLLNFKCFREQSFDLRPLTILTGANASGKSSIIQSVLIAHYISELLEKSDVFDINKIYDLNLGKATNLRNNDPRKDPETIKIQMDCELEDRNAFGSSFEFALEMTHSMPMLKVNNVNKEFAINHNIIYLNAERFGPRRYTTFSADEDLFIGYHGEYTNYVIDQADAREIRIHPELNIVDNTKFSAQVEAWLSLLISDTQFSFTKNSDFGLIQNYFQNEISMQPVLPTATGFGFTYTLPIIVAGLLATSIENSIIIIENPEAHLHPLAQSNMGKFLAKLSCCGVQVIIETHSEHIVDGARIQLTIDERKTEQLKINYFRPEDGNVNVLNIDLNNNGELSEWPDGFFDQRQIDLRRLMEFKRYGN